MGCGNREGWPSVVNVFTSGEVCSVCCDCQTECRQTESESQHEDKNEGEACL